jgi:RNA polymerase sigma factor (sigma-70 family)
MDPLLQPVVDASGDLERRRAVEELLVDVAAPIVRSVIQKTSFRFGPSARLRQEDEEDLAGTTMYRLVRRMAVDLSAHPIESFGDYVAGVTRHVCHDYFRQWKARARLVPLVADDTTTDLAVGLALEVASDDDPALQYEQTANVAATWREILDLPQEQRVAVLLNLRDTDGTSALRLLVLTGIATLQELADAMGLAPSDLQDMWRSLPMPDAEIAARLGTSRQRVINLRQAARKRLRRRTERKGW